MPETTIRPAEVDDARAINTLVAFSRADSYLNEERGIGEDWRTAVLAQMLLNESVVRRADTIRAAQDDRLRHLYLAAVDEQGITGMLYAERQEKKYELDSLFVASDRRSRGIGSKLMAVYLDWASPELPTELDVVEYNHGAIRFYERHGFNVVEGSESQIEGIPKLVMRHEATPKEEM